jgi:hypothetical protein
VETVVQMLPCSADAVTPARSPPRRPRP